MLRGSRRLHNPERYPDHFSPLDNDVQRILGMPGEHYVVERYADAADTLGRSLRGSWDIKRPRDLWKDIEPVGVYEADGYLFVSGLCDAGPGLGNQVHVREGIGYLGRVNRVKPDA